jgi:hypothetical protein
MSCCNNDAVTRNELILLVNKSREAAACAEANCGSSFTNATNAATSATNAANSATAAAASAAAAATSETNTENLWEQFNALYLGSFAVAPTTDNEGNPLQEGALYWNSVSNTMFAWDGSAWATATNFNEFTNFTATGTTTARNLVTRFSDVVNVKDFGAVGDGVTNDTAAIQSAILKAYQNNGGTVLCGSGKIYLITNSLIVPSNVTLDLNTSTFTGNVSSGSLPYNPSGLHIIESGYWNGTSLVSNKNTTLNSHRVLNMRIKNGYIINANCGIFLTNCNEGCYVENINYDGVAKATIMVACFYLKMFRSISRNSAQNTGQILHHIRGGNNNAMIFESISGVNVGVTFAINGPANFAIEFNDCSFEEGKSSINSIGILVGADAYISGLSINNGYFEGVKYGLIVDNGGGVYGGSLVNSIFNNNEYSVLSNQNGLRIFRITNNSIPDNGGTNRNIIDISASNNDVFVQMPSKVGSNTIGPVDFLQNLSSGNISLTESTSVWLNNAPTPQVIAKSQPSLANKSKLNLLPFEGANIITTSDTIPFCNNPVINPTNAIIDTAIYYDNSNALVFNFNIQDFNGSYNLHGTIFGNTVYRLDAFSPTIAISNNSGLVRITIGNINTNSGSSFSHQGMIRHF